MNRAVHGRGILLPVRVIDFAVEDIGPPTAALPLPAVAPGHHRHRQLNVAADAHHPVVADLYVQVRMGRRAQTVIIEVAASAADPAPRPKCPGHGVPRHVNNCLEHTTAPRSERHPPDFGRTWWMYRVEPTPPCCRHAAGRTRWQRIMRDRHRMSVVDTRGNAA